MACLRWACLLSVIASACLPPAHCQSILELLKSDLKDLLKPTTTPEPTTPPPVTLSPVLSELAGSLLDSFFPSQQQPAGQAPTADVRQLAQQLVRTDPFTGEVLDARRDPRLLQQQQTNLLSGAGSGLSIVNGARPARTSLLNDNNVRGSLFPTGAGLAGRTDLPSNYVYPFAAPGTAVLPDTGGDQYSLGPTAGGELSALRSNLLQRAGLSESDALAVLRQAQSDAAQPAVSRFGDFSDAASGSSFVQAPPNAGSSFLQQGQSLARVGRNLNPLQQQQQQQQQQQAPVRSLTNNQFQYRTQPGGLRTLGSTDPWWAQGQGALPFVQRSAAALPNQNAFGKNIATRFAGLPDQRRAQSRPQNPFDFSSAPPIEFLLPRPSEMHLMPAPPPPVPLEELLAGRTQTDSLNFPFIDRAVGRNNVQKEAAVVTTPPPPPEIVGATCDRCVPVTLADLAGSWTQIYGSPQSLRDLYTTLFSLERLSDALLAGDADEATVDVAPLLPSCVGLQVAKETRNDNLTDAFLHYRDDSPDRRLHEQMGVMELRGKNLLLRLPSIDLPLCALLLRPDYVVLTETLGARRCRSAHLFARGAERFFAADNAAAARWIGERTRRAGDRGLLPVSVMPFPSLCHVPDGPVAAGTPPSVDYLDQLY